jgi:hypothetical protein
MGHETQISEVEVWTMDDTDAGAGLLGPMNP